MTEAPVLLARADGVLGELVLRRRPVDGRDVVELVANGVLLMDSGDASTERALADAALAGLAGLAGGGWHVAVGGLGLGFTLAAVLADDRVHRVSVLEIEPALVAWVRDGLVPASAGLLDDSRVDLVVGDVRDALPRLTGLDAVLLDVDNGPDFLVHRQNAAVYSPAFLGAAAGRLRPGGVLAVWSSHESASLATVLGDVVGPCEERRLVVRREGRELEYVLFLARRGSCGTAPPR